VGGIARASKRVLAVSEWLVDGKVNYIDTEPFAIGP